MRHFLLSSAINPLVSVSLDSYPVVPVVFFHSNILPPAERDPKNAIKNPGKGRCTEAFAAVHLMRNQYLFNAAFLYLPAPHK